jgi:hypothetical protein
MDNVVFDKVFRFIHIPLMPKIQIAKSWSLRENTINKESETTAKWKNSEVRQAEEKNILKGCSL